MTMDLVGTTLGEYRLDEMIGEGGMATVYKGFQESLQRWVAIKVLYYQEDTSLARFQREAKAIASLRHRNILIVYEYGDQDGAPYIVMEYVAGGTLEDRFDGRPMDWKQAIELTIPIAEALHYAHQQGIIHRDIKPSNVLMPQDDWPVLADFGLVKHSDEDQGLTRTGTFMGTPSYIAPEQARDVEVDYRADMYSLGVMLFEMATGQLPFDHENPNKILLSHVMDPPPAPRDINPNCPPALEQVILKTLQKTAEDRYADMQEFIDALKAVLTAPQSPPAGDIPSSKTTIALPTGEVVKEEEDGGFFGSLKRLFGRKKKATKTEKKTEDTGSKTAPRPQVQMSSDDIEEEFEGTIQLDLNTPASQTGPRLVFQEKNKTINVPMDKDTLIMGRTYRGNIADIDLEQLEASKYGVSRQHAQLLNKGSLWLLEDLGSLNGTFVNDVEVKGNPVVLKDGDTIRLSHMSLIFIQS